MEAKLEKHLRIAQRRQHATTGQEGSLKDVSKIANELRVSGCSERLLHPTCGIHALKAGKDGALVVIM